MTTVFADSSALVKLYVEEEHADVVRAALAAPVISHLARAEVPAAFWRKVRLGELAPGDAHVLCRAFESDLAGTPTDEPRFGVMPVGHQVLDRAAQLLPTHGLRAHDAVQLASALEARRVVASCDTVACFDDDLRRAAASEGFALLPA